MIRIPIIGIPIKPPPDLHRLTNTILASGNALLREGGRLLKPHGLSAVQFNVLHLLVDARAGLRPSELTAALVVDASSTTYVLDRMESLGWLQRRDDQADRRAWRIVLTPAGRALHDRVMPIYVTALRNMLRGLDPTVIGPMTRTLEEIQRAAHEAVETVLAVNPRRRP